MEEVFAKLEISEHLATFTSEGVGLEELSSCSEDDLKEAGLSLGGRKRLLQYLATRGAGGYRWGTTTSATPTVTSTSGSSKTAR